MNKDKYVFSQLIEFLDNNKFRHLVDKYDGNRYVKHFTCWNQLLGLGRKPIAKTTFASANQSRDYRIFALYCEF